MVFVGIGRGSGNHHSCHGGVGGRGGMGRMGIIKWVELILIGSSSKDCGSVCYCMTDSRE